jgi:hypothetical protein
MHYYSYLNKANYALGSARTDGPGERVKRQILDERDYLLPLVLVTSDVWKLI